MAVTSCCFIGRSKEQSLLRICCFHLESSSQNPGMSLGVPKEQGGYEPWFTFSGNHHNYSHSCPKKPELHSPNHSINPGSRVHSFITRLVLAPSSFPEASGNQEPEARFGTLRFGSPTHGHLPSALDLPPEAFILLMIEILHDLA